MKRNYGISNYILRNILIACFSLSIILSINELLNYELTLYEVIKTSFIIIVIIALTFYNRYTLIATVFIMLIFLSTSTLDRENSGFNMYYFIGDFINAVESSINSHTFPTYFQSTMMTLILFLLDLALYFLEFNFKKFNPFFIILPGLILYIVPGFLNDDVSLEGFLLFAFTSMLYYFMYKYRKNENSNGLQYFVGFIMSIILSLLVLLSSTYVHFKYPNSLNIIKDIAYYVEEFDLFKLGSGDNPVVYNYHRTNFDGVKNKDQTIVMTLTRSNAEYLKGASYNYYSDNNWAINDDSISDNQSILLENYYSPILEQGLQGLYFLQLMSYGVPIQDLRSKSSLNLNEYSIIEDEMTIEYNNLISYMLFKPYNVSSLIPDSNMASQNNTYELSPQDTITTVFPLKEGTTYSTQFLKIDFDNPAIHNYFRHSYSGLDNDLLNAPNIQNYLVDTNISLIDYTSIPDTIAPEVYQLTEDITAPYTTNYDKVRALESYLAGNFTYTLDVPELPEDQDFISFFLLESKEGYCTYYASSMAIMVRMLGLPSRYVTGYRIPSFDVEEYSDLFDPALIDTDTITIREESAHAWVEVYFEGFGWVPFEPTAPFYTAYRNALPKEEQLIPPQPNIEDKKPVENQNKPRIFLSEKTKDLITLIFWLLLLLTPFGYKIFKTLTFKLKDNTSKVIDIYKRILYGYNLLRLGKNHCETASEYCERVHHELWYIDERFDEVTQIFEKARYSNKKIEKEEVQYLLNYLQFIKKEVYVRSIFKYLIFWLKC